eukprot:CAMPEP_0183709626 /NCGR_PEP_ID=MMETSP0737-20130205/5637_1 /TAXON_ID=385413 /ORGANISM="Thalassiosira miniscula, Strain CCMP1093" /LENGTH=30 /DNA_ID= /DNA_START= /DNA_END= /DNA_ORIENTATION=
MAEGKDEDGMGCLSMVEAAQSIPFLLHRQA